MAILLDSGFFLAFCHPIDKNHNSAKNIFNRMAEGEFGLIYTTPYVISETSTLILIRTNNNTQILLNFKDIIYGPERFVRILPWSVDFDRQIWDFFISANAKAKSNKELLSFVDAANIVYCKERNIENIAAYDGHFSPFLTILN